MSFDIVAIVFVIVATVTGLSVGIFSLADALHEKRVAKRINGVRLIYACATLRSQSLRVFKLTSFLVLAINSLLDYSDRRIISILLLLGVVLATTSDAVLDRLTSHKIVHHLRDVIRAEEEH